MVEEDEEAFEKLLDLESKLEAAKDMSDLGKIEKSEKSFRRAYQLIEYSRDNLREAENILDRKYAVDYLRAPDRDNFLDCSFEVDIERLDSSSNTSVVGMALPQLYSELMDAREYVLKKHQESGLEIELSDYPTHRLYNENL